MSWWKVIKAVSSLYLLRSRQLRRFCARRLGTLLSRERQVRS
jgi:hypothetical protein